MTAQPTRQRRFHLIRGIVQGVGFRPFVSRLAASLSLTGCVSNTSRGVEVEAQGPTGALEAFERRLRDEAPPASLILEMETRQIQPVDGEAAFRIRASRVDPAASVIVPPDIAVCPACLAELFDPADRRCGYPFLNCTACGPRYTVIESIPYDRPRTSMRFFELCHQCQREYDDPANRRFHAQPTACPACGPRLEARDAGGEPLDGDPLGLAREALARGEIVALLGLGGFHLAADAFSEDAVVRLRQRKGRPKKPLAVMAASPEVLNSLVHTDAEVLSLLKSPAAPIVLLPAREGSGIAPSVAPGQHTLGVFLPYTPLHHLLFRQNCPRALVMTSGNRGDEPMISTWEGAMSKLRGVADLFLTHDRPIVHPVDDSVMKALPGRAPLPIRRARGFSPRPVALPPGTPRDVTLLCLGAELLATVTVVRDGMAFVGPHVGDLKNLDTEEAFRASARHLLDLLQARPDAVVCDLHPLYRTSAIASEWEAGGTPAIRIQHHEAHAAAAMGEHGATRDGLALALDGIGYGADGGLWGGEILLGGPGGFRRAAHLSPVPQPGGDRAAQEPWRMAASHLRARLGGAWRELPLAAFRDRPEEERAALDAMMAKGVMSPPTSSCGRLFDAAAAILGFCGPLRYSAHAAMELEALAARATFFISLAPGSVQNGRESLLLDPGPILEDLARRVLDGQDLSALALGFHLALADLLAEGALRAARGTRISDAFLTGGCLQNALLSQALTDRLEARSLTVHTHGKVPPNDGGISYGQAVAALARMRASGG